MDERATCDLEDLARAFHDASIDESFSASPPDEQRGPYWDDETENGKRCTIAGVKALLALQKKRAKADPPDDIGAFLAEVETRASKATPGPWEECGSDRGGCVCGLLFGPECPVAEAFAEDENAGAFLTVAQKHHNAQFIVHARTDVPRIIAIVREQQKRSLELIREKDAMRLRLQDAVAERDDIRARVAALEPEANAWRKGQEILREMRARVIPCGHTIGDLIGGEGSVTKCGACLAAKQVEKGSVKT